MKLELELIPLPYSYPQLTLFFLALILSAFAHLWNPTGFPNVNVDEGVYLGRALSFIDTHNPKDPYIGYDHPYFGQIFLAAFLYISNYESLLDPSGVFNHELLFLYPRILMGLLALLDTFLIFKIVELRYNTNAGLIAALFFAVMPITWLTRWILLDVIQLPFILLSIFFAIKSCALNDEKATRSSLYLPTLLACGTSLGLAIFTKIPAFTLIPVIGYLIWNPRRTRWIRIGIWLIPTVLIPSIWIVHAASMDQFDKLWDAISGQLNRENRPLFAALFDFFKLDPLISLIALLAFIYSVIKRDVLVLFSIIPFLLFIYFIGYVVVFHLVVLIVTICISISKLLIDIIVFVWKKKYVYQFSVIAIGSILVFGLYSTVINITSDTNSGYFRTATYVDQYLLTNRNNITQSDKDNKKDIGIVGHPFFFWTEKYRLHYNGYYLSENKFENMKILFVIDKIFTDFINQNTYRSTAFLQLFSSFDTKKIYTTGSNLAENEHIEILLTNFSRYDKNKINAISFLDDNFVSSNARYTDVEKDNKQMKITMNTTKAKQRDNLNRVSSNSSVLLNGTSSYLYLTYYNPFRTSGTFTIELNDFHSNKRIWSQQLTNQEKEKTIFFILPKEVLGKKINANIRVHMDEKEVGSIVLRNWILFN